MAPCKLCILKIEIALATMRRKEVIEKEHVQKNHFKRLRKQPKLCFKIYKTFILNSHTKQLRLRMAYSKSQCQSSVAPWLGPNHMPLNPVGVSKRTKNINFGDDHVTV